MVAEALTTNGERIVAEIRSARNNRPGRLATSVGIDNFDTSGRSQTLILSVEFTDDRVSNAGWCTDIITDLKRKRIFREESIVRICVNAKRMKYV
jgi:transcriptional/translational regulatory protein YebC/TACO1